jgi:hypothetical protein
MWVVIRRPFLGSVSVNMFLLLGTRYLIMQHFDYNNGRDVFSTWSVPGGYKRDEVWSLVSCDMVASREWRKRLKLNNLHCQKPLPGNGW